MKPNIGIEEKNLKVVADFTNTILADAYVLYVKTQNFHWNIVDPRFSDLHLFLEKQYEELAEAADIIAERVRMLGGKALGSMKEFLSHTTLKESDSNLSGDEMLKELLKDHEAVCVRLRKGIELSQDNGDEGTADMFIQRLRDSEKAAWMLRAHFVK